MQAVQIQRDDFAQLTEADFTDMWKHAFAYANFYISTENAAMYADHYVRHVKESGETDWNFLPSHPPIFGQWIRETPLKRQKPVTKSAERR